MSKTEIYEALALQRNTLIQAHVQMNQALDQIDKLMEKVRQDIEAESPRP